MTHNRKWSLGAAALVLTVALAGAAAYKKFHRPDFGPPDRPVPRLDVAENWVEHYRRFAGAPFPADPQILFLGDSQQLNWLEAGRPVWDQYFAPRGAAVLAVGGDATSHVLWRFAQGQMPPIKPRLVVLQIGTNNLAFRHDEPEVVAGVAAVVEQVRARLPDARLIVTAIFPRHPTPHKIRDKIRRINADLATRAPAWNAEFLDVGDQYLDPQGSLVGIAPDHLHLTEQGYRTWAKALLPLVDRLAPATRATTTTAPTTAPATAPAR